MRKITSIFSTVLLILLVSVFIFSCKSKKADVAANLDPNVHAVSVLEVIQTTNYTYLNVFENDREYWIAVNKREAKKGDLLYYSIGMEMQNFESKELKRTFESIYFVQDISDKPITSQPGGQANTAMGGTAPGQGQMPSQPAGKKAPVEVKDIKITPAKGGITLSQLFSDKEKYAGKTVTIKGKVVRYNAGIMDKNWAHIQDGTKAGDQFDLTVTTLEEVALGDEVTFTGTINLNRDFGAGYSYDIIMEDAKKK
ncbi:MAG: GW dipeptide domain-containing protein [Bacteroidales bacterium]